MSRYDVAVVGAGLAGLACARVLCAAGLEVTVAEAADAVGGRVRTDRVDGYLLDRGFQVLNTAYPEARRVLDLEALDLRALDSAAALYADGRRIRLPNPLHEPTTVGDLLRAPLGGLRAKSALARYTVATAMLPVEMLRRRPDDPATTAWRDAGIPADVVERLLVPFFAGVTLDPGLGTSRRYVDLMMRMFARGRSVVPARGMQAMPEQLAARLPPGTVRLGCPVHAVRPDEIDTGGIDTGGDTGGDAVRARKVVVAVDGWTAARLLPGCVEPPQERGVTTVYHAAPAWPGATGTLVVDAEASPVTNTVVMSAAAPEYAPAGRALVATSLVHDGGHVDVGGLRARLTRLHGTDTSTWEEIARYDVPRALPAMPAPHRLRTPVRRRQDGAPVYVCGDYCDTSSIQGALVSGRRAAETVLTDLGVNR
jgi:phytoene dehydrogenase-like protein